MQKYVLGEKVHRKYLLVEPKVHALVKSYAQEKGITIAEATYILLSKAIPEEYFKKND